MQTFRPQGFCGWSNLNSLAYHVELDSLLKENAIIGKIIDVSQSVSLRVNF